MAPGVVISNKKWNWVCPDIRFYHDIVIAIKLFPLGGVAYTPVVGMRMSWTGYESLRNL